MQKTFGYFAKHIKILCFVFLVCLAPTNSMVAAGRNIHDMDWKAFAESLLRNQDLIRGNWLFEKSWSSWPCNGRYRFVTSAETLIDQIDFDPR